MGQDRSHVLRITRKASWSLARRGALFLVNLPRVFAVTLLPQILSHTVTRISTHRTINAALPSEVQVLPSVQRAPGSQSYTMTITSRQYGGLRLHVQSRRRHHWKGLPLKPERNSNHFTCKHCRGPGSISRPSNHEKSVLTSRLERCAISHKSARGICRNTLYIILYYIIYII